ncbi:hypothetical protein BGZ73_004832 [Actinomortierella ambigua]|nr:hypothetical protein BGZ73_004832 [Actinomortierella ambigua]
MSFPQPSEKPHIVIVGAGLGGLMLAALLEKQNVSYVVLERATKVVPLGSGMSVGANILPVYEQLGILEQIRKISKPSKFGLVKDEQRQLIGKVDMTRYEERTGYDCLIVPRPELYDLLLTLVPAEKVLKGKKITAVHQTEHKASVECADGTLYDGDIVVGADGAYSTVRKSLFSELKEAGKLSQSDQEVLKFSNVCLVGTTDPLDPAKFPGVDGYDSKFQMLMSDHTSHSCLLFCIPNNRICWFLTEQLSGESSKEHGNFKNSEWGPGGTEKMVEACSSFPCPVGDNLTMGDLFSQTPREGITKVMLEEKVFESWYSKRVVLIGDAAHKMVPAAGQGAINAMQDAVVLANRIYDMSANTLPEIEEAFKAYYDERYPTALNSFETSKQFAKAVIGQKWTEKLFRKITMGYMPTWVNNYIVDSMHYYRPMACFLPQIPNKGIAKVKPQAPSKRNLQMERTKASAV